MKIVTKILAAIFNLNKVMKTSFELEKKRSSAEIFIVFIQSSSYKLLYGITLDSFFWEYKLKMLKIIAFLKLTKFYKNTKKLYYYERSSP